MQPNIFYIIGISIICFTIIILALILGNQDKPMRDSNASANAPCHMAYLDSNSYDIKDNIDTNTCSWRIAR